MGVEPIVPFGMRLNFRSIKKATQAAIKTKKTTILLGVTTDLIWPSRKYISEIGSYHCPFCLDPISFLTTLITSVQEPSSTPHNPPIGSSKSMIIKSVDTTTIVTATI